jgi:hypothetical protein
VVWNRARADHRARVQRNFGGLFVGVPGTAVGLSFRRQCSALRHCRYGCLPKSNLSALRLALFGLEDRAQGRWNRICRQALAQRGGLAEERSE